jgi:hypothetical protein
MIAADNSADSRLTLATEVVTDDRKAGAPSLPASRGKMALKKPTKKTAAEKPTAGIPLYTPEPLPDGVHIAPYRSWTGELVLLVITDGHQHLPQLRLHELRSPLADDPFDYSAAALSGYLHPWNRGVYRDPHFRAHGQFVERYLAIDSHGRSINTEVVGSRITTEQAIEACRRALLTEDPIIRTRPRGETRF